jgi:perosamine synthetase
MKSHPFIPVNEPLLGALEKKYLIECIDSGWISSEGPFVERFENELCAFTTRNHAIAVSSGTAAIDVAIEALGISKGDEVILPSFTIISCINQIIRVGAKPVLVDSDPLTWNMDINQIENKITSRTKAILVVHIYGLPVDLDPVLNLAKKYNLMVLEDAAEMLGQTYKGSPCGSFGDISILSFYPNKHTTTGEGGMVLTNDFEIAERCRSLRNLGFQPDIRFVHERLGWNYRMTNMQAAIGVAQFSRLDEFVDRKRRMGAIYTEKLQALKGLQLPLVKTSFAKNIYWVFGIVLEKKINFTAKEAIIALRENGIGCRPFFYPMHQQPVLKKMGYFKGEHYPESENLYQRGFYIPSGLALEDDQILRVVEILRKIFR